jgi:hypothetical protein
MKPSPPSDLLVGGAAGKPLRLVAAFRDATWITQARMTAYATGTAVPLVLACAGIAWFSPRSSG